MSNIHRLLGDVLDEGSLISYDLEMYTRFVMVSLLSREHQHDPSVFTENPHNLRQTCHGFARVRWSATLLSYKHSSCVTCISVLTNVYWFRLQLGGADVQVMKNLKSTVTPCEVICY